MSYLDDKLSTPNFSMGAYMESNQQQLAEVIDIIDETDVKLIVAQVSALLTTRYGWDTAPGPDERSIILTHPSHTNRIVISHI